jgi:hypothetical protein
MELESLIRQYVRLGRRSPKGFEACVCASCNDYKERGGFKFDGEAIGYHCFNCGLDTKFDSSQYSTPSEKFRTLLDRFGIPEEEVSKAVGRMFVERKGAPTGPKDPQAKPSWSPPRTFEAPPGAIPVMSDDSPWCDIARAYLQERALDPAAYKYFVSEDPKLVGRVIIPYYHRERLIYWQGRALTDTITPRYYNPPASDKEKLIFNYDELQGGTGNLYVTEGALDALSIGPAAALSDSHSSEWKFAELRKAADRGRKIVFVIDKNKVGYDLGVAALKEGWSVAVMPDGVDDANRCRMRFGRLWLLNHLASTNASGIAGEVLLRMKCDRTDSNRKTKHVR